MYQMTVSNLGIKKPELTILQLFKIQASSSASDNLVLVKVQFSNYSQKIMSASL